MSKIIVLDASVLGTWWLQEPTGLIYAESVLQKISTGFISVNVPYLFFDEGLNILLKAEIKGRLTKEGYHRCLALLRAFQHRFIISLPELSATFLEEKSVLAHKHSLRSYDVNYLHLALSKGLLLATLDDRLIRASKAEGCYYE